MEVPNPFAWQLSARVSHTFRSLGHMIAAAAFADEYWHHRSDCRNILINAHTNSRILRLCDISLRSQTLPAPESWDFMELILLYLTSEKDITVQHLTVPGTRTRRCSCLSGGKRRTNMEIRCLINPSIELAGTFDVKGLICQRFPKWCVLGIRLGFGEFKSRRTLGDLWWDDRNVYSLQLTFRHVWIEKTTKTFVLSPWHCHRKLLCSFRVFPIQIFSEYETKRNANKCFLHISHLKIADCTYRPQM